jgi:hypothetical protein
MAIMNITEIAARLVAGDLVCPVCGEIDPVSEAPITTEGTIEQDCACNSCLSSWTLVYHLVAMKDLVSCDHTLSALQLHTKYSQENGDWGQHPKYSRAFWREEVVAGDTQRGYWDWVVAQLEE